MREVTITVNKCTDCPHIRYAKARAYAYCYISDDVLFFLRNGNPQIIPDSCPLLEDESNVQTKADANDDRTFTHTRAN